jgi:hypothetical protein
MKTLYLIAIALLGSSISSAAQAPDNRINKEKLAPLLAWVGKWKGEGTMMGPGGEKKSTVDEKVEAKLDNTVLVVEGLGKSIDPSTKAELTVHNALGIISFDAASNQYRFKTYTKEGRSSDGWFNVLSESNYQWGFETPGGKVRYSIVIDGGKKTWNEIGEFSQDGNTWRKFFEMNLTKVD